MALWLLRVSICTLTHVNMYVYMHAHTAYVHMSRELVVRTHVILISLR